MTGVIFYITLTVAAPAFPIIIIALVPVRLLVINRLWNRETLRSVDAWACKDGTPEDDEDRRNGIVTEGEDTGKGKEKSESNAGVMDGEFV